MLLRRWTAVASLAAGVAGLAGCTGGGSTPTATAAATPGPTSPTSLSRAPTTGPPPTDRPPQGTAATTTTTSAPRPVEGRCPYLDAGTVAEIVGQHITRTTITPTRPHPGCSFYRPNSEAAVEITVSVLANPIQAQAKAIAIGGRAANPVSGVGDGGVVTVGTEGAVLAISTGRTLVVVRINQRSSLEAKEIARYVVDGL